MQTITQSLRVALPEAIETCAAAEMLIPYIKEDTFTGVPRFLGQQVALRPQLSLLEIFNPIQAATILSCPQSPSSVIEESQLDSR